MSNTTKQYLDYNGLQTYHNGIKDYIVIHGYYYNGSFYKESTHTTLITPQTNRLYVDLGANALYEYKNNAYTAISAATDKYVTGVSFADDSSSSASSPVKMTLTREGTTDVTGNIPVVSSSSAGVAPKGGTVTSDRTAKYLREDGTWVTPSYTSYSEMSIAELLTGTETTDRVINASVLKAGIIAHTIHYGTCSTPASTAVKMITILDTNFQVYQGCVIAVKFTYTNTSSRASICTDGLGNADPIKYNGSIDLTDLTAGGEADIINLYLWDGSYWQWIGHSKDKDTTYTEVTTSASGLMSATDKTKLNGISTGAEVNQNAFSNIAVGNTTVQADSATDTVTFIAGDGISLSADATNDEITVSASPTDTYSSTGTLPVSGKGVAAALGTLDVSSVGGANKYISAISETNGKISAIASDIDTEVTSNSSNLITSGAVYTAIQNLPEPMVFKGTVGAQSDNPTITSLPVDGSATKGDTYKVITDGTYAGKLAKNGDTFICLTKTSSANTWELIPSGDEPTGTVTNVAVVNATDGGLSITGSPITTSGTINIGHSNVITAGTAKGSDAKTLTFGDTFEIPSVTYDKNGHITSKGTTTMTMPANPNSNTIPSAYCASGSSVADKVASCTGFALLDKSYLHVLIRNSNTVESALTFNVNSTGAKAIAINGSASSSTNYELPAGTYLVYYVDNTFYFRTDGKLTANITGTAGYSSKAAASGGTAVSLVTTGEKYVWNNKSDFDGAYASLSGKPTLGTAAALDVAVSGDASSTQVVLGNDSRLTSNIVASSTQPSGQPTGGIWLKIE